MRKKLSVIVIMMMLASCGQRNRQVLIGTIEDVNSNSDYSRIERVLDYKVSGNTLETSEFTIIVDGKHKGSWWNTEDGANIHFKTAKGKTADYCTGHISTDFGYMDVTCKIGDRISRIRAGTCSFEVFSGW
jgi:hypothetical protein